jgi:ketosteroid isomerase-like protein
MNLQEVSDRLELRCLVDDYARAIDRREPDRLVATFTEDGYFGVFAPDSETAHAAFRGAAELRSLMGMLSDYGPTMHLMANHYVHIDPDGATASGTVYALARHVVDREGTRQNLQMTVRYEDRYRRTDVGWRIAHRRIIRDWNELSPVMAEHIVF